MSYESDEFLSIEDTYRKFTFSLSLAMLYPNPHNEKKRFLFAGLMVAGLVPAYIMWLCDVIICIGAKNFNDLTRQLSIGIPIMFGQFKVFTAIFKRNIFQRIIQTINSDYEKYNRLGIEHRAIVNDCRRSLIKLEKCWSLAVICTTAIFPIVACISMMINYLKDNYERVMIHEIYVPFLDAIKLETPYYEILFVYEIYVVYFLTVVYMGFDGFFFVSCYHICLKIQLISCDLEHLFVNVTDLNVVKERIGSIVDEQCKAFRFMAQVLNKYEYWMMLVFLLSVNQICMNMFQILTTSGQSIDCRYIVFIIAAVFHIYMPCYLATIIETAGAEMAMSAYCSGWEQIPEVGIRRCILFIIARAQIPLQMTPMNLVTFNMQFFLFVMQKSYSVFTILRRKM